MVVFPLFLIAAAHAGACSDGREAVSGHCCWEGQTWDGKRCAGAPDRCPDPLIASSFACVATACPGGLIRDPSGNCCPPGQAWDADNAMCAGPTMPGSHDFIAPDANGACPEGMAVTEDGAHCCGPRQMWSSDKSACDDPPVLVFSASYGGPYVPPPDPPGPAVLRALGGLTKGEIAAVIQGQGKAVQRCVDASANPAATGRMKVDFTVDLDGSVSNPTLTLSTLDNPSVETRVLGVLRKTPFPDPRDEKTVEVTYQFVFGAPSS